VKTVTLQQQVRFDASPHDIYEAFLNAKRHSAFTGAKATIVRRIGGKMTAWNRYIKGTFLLFSPNKRFEQTWQTQGWPKKQIDSLLGIRLARRGKKTELTMIHSGVPPSLAKGFRSGWPHSYWRPLAAYLKRNKK
jgi:activator of HSP90 ATPase